MRVHNRSTVPWEVTSGIAKSLYKDDIWEERYWNSRLPTFSANRINWLRPCYAISTCSPDMTPEGTSISHHIWPRCPSFSHPSYHTGGNINSPCCIDSR